MQNSVKIDYSKLLGFDLVSDEMADGIDFRTNTHPTTTLDSLKRRHPPPPARRSPPLTCLISLTVGKLLDHPNPPPPPSSSLLWPTPPPSSTSMFLSLAPSHHPKLPSSIIPPPSPPPPPPPTNPTPMRFALISKIEILSRSSPQDTSTRGDDLGRMEPSLRRQMIRSRVRPSTLPPSAKIRYPSLLSPLVGTIWQWGTRGYPLGSAASATPEPRSKQSKPAARARRSSAPLMCRRQ